MGAQRGYEPASGPENAEARNQHGRLVVLEFFQYECPHCYALEAHLNPWERTSAAAVELRRVPIIYVSAHRPYAQLYYSLDLLGYIGGSKDLHHEVYDRIHRAGIRIFSGQDVSEAELSRLAAALGVEPDRFAQVFRSKEVSERIAQAEKLQRSYGIVAWPSLIIGGKYLTRVDIAGSEAKVIEVIESLTTSERQRAITANQGRQ